jgi:hypothetical protein
MQFASRFPSQKQLALVYVVIAVVLYSWSIIRFFWRLPSFIMFATVDEIAIMYDYLIIVNFLESLTLLLIPILISIVLPAHWFFDRFVTKSTLLLAMGLWYLSYIANHISAGRPFPYDLIRIAPFVVLLIFVLMYVLDQISFLRKIIIEITERLTVFLYIIIPITAICFLVILFRNIF